MENDNRVKLLELIRDKAYKEGVFTLASGQESHYYINCKEVTLDATGSLLVGRMIFDRIKNWGVTAVGGMELGSVPISSAVSLVSALEGAPVGNFIVRKESKDHGMGKKIEGKIGAGSKVAVVEDVVTTGGSTIKAIEAITEAGAQVAGIVALVDREMGGREAFEKRGLKFEPLYTVSDLSGG